MKRTDCKHFDTYERVITLVVWHQQRLVGYFPFHLKFALKVTDPLQKRQLQQIFANNIWDITASKKSSIITHEQEVNHKLSNEL